MLKYSLNSKFYNRLILAFKVLIVKLRRSKLQLGLLYILIYNLHLGQNFLKEHCQFALKFSLKKGKVDEEKRMK
jgi:creatinine amidohydrolase/Fe(II)-dependent formamide hydrolase-like protein